jgi:general nucleoside transport system permease protein
VSQAVVFVAETLRMAIPYVACALGGLLTERAGVINVALEGTLLVSGFVAMALAFASGSAVLGLVGGVVAGAALCAGHSTLVVRAGISDIVSGIALNIAVAGGVRVGLRLLFHSSANSPAIGGFPVWSNDSFLGPLLRALTSPVLVLLALIAALLPTFLARTRLGLHLRAAGEAEAAALAAGVDVSRVRILAGLFSGAVAGLGGVFLVFDQHHFDSGMSGGRGYIALAALVLGRHQPWLTVGACLAFASLESAQIALQDRLPVPTQAVQMLPYVAVLVLLGVAGRRHLTRA